MKKRLTMVLGLLVAIAGLVGYMAYSQSIQYGQDTVIRVEQRDENDVPITAPTKLVRKAGHRNPFKSAIPGYELTTENPLKTLLPRKNQTVRLGYQSERTQTELHRQLQTARYWQVGAQNVTTPVLNGTQYQKGAQSVSRISTSHDGLTWTRLPISYPKMAAQNPWMVYQDQKLTLLDKGYYYQTMNFRDWHRYQFKLTNQQFRNGQVVGVVGSDQRQKTVVIQAISQLSGDRELFYGNWSNNGMRNVKWQRLDFKPTQLRGIVNLTQSRAGVYLTATRGRQVQIYGASKLTGHFDKVGRLTLKKKRKTQYVAVNLVAPTKHQLRLYFNEIDQHHVLSGTYYQPVTRKAHLTGTPRRLNTDFMWTEFHVTKGPNE
ncbi:hypothetical protein D1831_12410 [Lactiplantibacillus garii]|uniref:Polysaccharide biosynthesis protein n=1 Tax=Lactiplantibacillus garii TaxID=2306423 RepID=A0A426D479_9LACO|nr:hypothetical protein [Lactiplantibacillus garii]RRK09473.1 hypothetical protein D1831_12410 [Lactiplantibacillus garii]